MNGFSDYIDIKDTIKLMTKLSENDYKINGLVDLMTMHKSIKPLFFVENVKVIKELDGVYSHFYFAGVCCLTNIDDFKHLIVNKTIGISHLNVVQVFEQSHLETTPTNELQITENDSINVMPQYRTVFDDSGEEVIEHQTDDFTNTVTVKVTDIRFLKHAITEVFSMTKTKNKKPPVLSDAKERSYLLIIGAMCELLNQKHGYDKAPFRTKDELVNAITTNNKGVYGLAKNNIHDKLTDGLVALIDARKKAEDKYTS